MRPKRIALYSHDTMGLGHIRRNLLIAHSLSAMDPEPAILLICGTPESLRLQRPKCADILALPGYKKLPDGRYTSRSLRIPLDELTSLRAATIERALQEFQPDALIVDKVPSGAMNELLPSLESLRSRGARAILGLRDILDDAESTKQEWEANKFEALVADYFDDIWVYGDRNVFDVRKEYAFSQQLRERATYTGYLAPLPLCKSKVSDNVLCLVGGGQDGYDLAKAFSLADYGSAKRGVLITGPFMPENEVADLATAAEKRKNLTVIRFDNVGPHLARANRIVSMGGYNTVCEILANRKQALIVPRSKPRLEQTIRAERLAARNAVTALPMEQLSSDSISEYLNKRSNEGKEMNIDLNGCSGLIEKFHKGQTLGI
ncbi:MAG: glycosyl transferase family 28 [Armatimonadota bacterium]|nr:glycosyl transferase family 28 [Armatimonadota bacterium]